MSVKSYSLTTAARGASYMDISTPTGAKLAAMEAIIDSITEFIENYIGRRVKKTTYTQEMYDTENGQTLNLNNFPVDEDSTFLLERRTSSLNEDDWEPVDSEYYHVEYDAGIILCASGIEFDRTIRGYRVTYTAGYDFDNSSTYLSDTEAGDLELAMWQLLEAIWNKRKGGSGIESEKIGDYSVKYTKYLMENPDTKAILDKYAAVNDELGVITPLQI